MNISAQVASDLDDVPLDDLPLDVFELADRGVDVESLTAGVPL
jgi:hypothetical protein